MLRKSEVYFASDYDLLKERTPLWRPAKTAGKRYYTVGRSEGHNVYKTSGHNPICKVRDLKDDKVQ